MAVGRISGPLLKSNLTRGGIDLAFETNLLYLDVNNSRLGVKTSSPQYELDVNGTTKTTNLVATTATLSDISFANNTISTNSPYLNLGTLDNVVYQNKLRIDSIDIEGNTITTNASNANLELRANGTGSIVIEDISINGSTISSANNLTLTPAAGSNVVIDSTGAIKLPSGTTAQRPTPVAGYTRYNNELNVFEGNV